MLNFGDRPAFPVPSNASQQGVSVRDWLAAIALQGVVTKGLDVIGDRVVTEKERNLMLARHAYGLADAMLTVIEEQAAATAQ